MPVRAEEVTVGSLFITAELELRKVVFVRTRADGRTVVWYQRKSASVPNRPLLFAHNQAGAPVIEDFVAACDHRLTWAEICRLRDQGILLSYE